MQKRRSAFIHRIRTQQKDSIKNGIRRQLLSQRTTQNTYKYSPLVSSSRPSWIGDKEEEEQAIRIFEDRIVELLKLTFTNANINIEFVSRSLLDAFTVDIKQATSQNDLIQCYKQGLNLFNTLRQTLPSQSPQGLLDETPLCYMRQWQNTFNLVLFRIKISKMAQDSHSQYVDSQLNTWNTNTLSILSDIWEADQTISPMIHQDIKCILIEISQLFILLSNYEQGMVSMVDEVFNEQMIKHLSFLLRLHFVQDEAKAEITELFLEITKMKWDNIYKRVLANDYIDYIRMVIAYEQEYKQTNHNNNNKIHKRIVTNMLQFIVQGSYLASSDQFWEKGLCSQLLAAEKQGIKDKNMRCNIITVLFVCITSFTYRRTLTLIQETTIFEWVLQVINQMIDTCYGDQLKTDIITDGIYVLRFFLQLGEQISQSNTNPYRLKLQYSSGEMILSKCKQGRAFLREIGWEVEQL